MLFDITYQHSNPTVREGMWAPRGRLIGDVLGGRTLGTVRLREWGVLLDVFRIDPQACCGCSNGAVASRGARMPFAQTSTSCASTPTLPWHLPICKVKISVSI